MVVAAIIVPAFAVATGIVHETIDLASTIGSTPMEKLIAQHKAKPLDWVSTSTQSSEMPRSRQPARPDSWCRAS